MKLNFIETAVLSEALALLNENGVKTITKSQIINVLYDLRQNTDKDYVHLRESIKLIAHKIEFLSEESIKQIVADSKTNKISNSICYSLPKN